MRRARSTARPEPCLQSPVIVGGGHTGLLLAIALDHAGLAPVLLDREPVRNVLEAPFDGRALALMQGSKRVFDALGIWPEFAPLATPIWGVEVKDEGSGATIAYDARELGDQPFGYGIETRTLRAQLLRCVLARPGIELQPATRLARLLRRSDRVQLGRADGNMLETSLAIGADGRDSSVRSLAGIGLQRWRYRQSAITFAFRQGSSPSERVREYLRPAGPLALLPIGKRLCSVTWIERAGIAEALLASGGQRLTAGLRTALRDSVEVVELVGQPAAYPIVGQLAARYTAPRVALVGDAAHGLHPIHAQGWNLGVRDVAALTEVLADAAAQGLDLGSSEVLLRYQRWRASDAHAMFSLTDGLNRLFCNDLAPAKLIRGAGLTLIDRVTPLKRFVMRHGMGMGGNLPKLARGEPLASV